MRSDMIDKRNNSYVMTGCSHEIGVLLSDKVTYDKPIAKITVPSITPEMNADTAIENRIPNQGNRVINGANVGSTSITTTNYFEIPIPKHLFTIKEIQITPNTTHGGEDNAVLSCAPKATIIYNEFLKGQRFIVTLDIFTVPLVVGVIE